MSPRWLHALVWIYKKLENIRSIDADEAANDSSLTAVAFYVYTWLKVGYQIIVTVLVQTFLQYKPKCNYVSMWSWENVTLLQIKFRLLCTLTF